MSSIISIKNLTKIYDNGFKALDSLSLEIKEGEILALLGPNGAGKTTLISAVCGLLSVPKNTITVGGFDVSRDYRNSRSLIGLVPQEITIDIAGGCRVNYRLYRPDNRAHDICV